VKRRLLIAVVVTLLPVIAAAQPQPLTLQAPTRDLTLCNRMSYVAEAAIGIEAKGNAVTRGWLRLDPGQCRVAAQGPIEYDAVYVHARVLSTYGSAPTPAAGHVDLCIGQNNFSINGARNCRPGQRLVRFTQIKPTETEKGLSANLGEDAEYDDEQARLAGIQRLLVIAGYDANPIDGVQGPKTDAAIAQFIKDRKLPADAATQAGFFDTLMDAASRPEGIGFTWCNDTAFPVMAAIGLDEKGSIVTRGWYRVDPGKCVRPDMRGQAKRVFSYAEAVDSDSRALMRGGRPLAWGGSVTLCTRDVKFELSEQKNCEASGLSASGFAVIDLAAKPSTTVRFKETP
jgi:uncharacterized membrane protein